MTARSARPSNQPAKPPTDLSKPATGATPEARKRCRLSDPNLHKAVQVTVRKHGPSGELEDLFQSALVAAWASPHVPDEDRPCLQYACGIARRVAKGWRRKEGRRVDREAEEYDADTDNGVAGAARSIEELFAAREQVEALEQKVKASEERAYRWLLRHALGESLYEIAGDEDLPYMNVYSATTRLRGRLADARRFLAVLAMLGGSAAVFRRELYGDIEVAASPFAPHAFGPLSAAAQLGYLAAAVAAFVAVAYLTRARLLRAGAALAGAMAFAAVAVAIDGVAYDVGFWRFPGAPDPSMATVPAYLGQALVFGGCAALLAWRVRRSSGWLALVGLTLGVAAVGWARDHAAAWLWPGLLTFGPARGSALADGVAWVFAVSFAFGVARVAGGPSTRDALRALPLGPSRQELERLAARDTEAALSGLAASLPRDIADTAPCDAGALLTPLARMGDALRLGIDVPAELRRWIERLPGPLLAEAVSALAAETKDWSLSVARGPRTSDDDPALTFIVRRRDEAESAALAVRRILASAGHAAVASATLGALEAALAAVDAELAKLVTREDAERLLGSRAPMSRDWAASFPAAAPGARSP